MAGEGTNKNADKRSKATGVAGEGANENANKTNPTGMADKGAKNARPLRTTSPARQRASMPPATPPLSEQQRANCISNRLRDSRRTACKWEKDEQIKP